jgi:hypothetical protein
MKRLCLGLLFGAGCIGAPSVAQPTSAPVSVTQARAPRQIRVESYYRVKWGAGAEFKKLYEKNEAALLREIQRLGFITDLRIDEPFTHLAGGPRWDLRASITYRDAASAVEAGGTYDQTWEAARARLIPNKSAYDAEEIRRFSLLEDHWDVIVTRVEGK